MRALGEAPRDLTELQQATNLPRATAHRLAVALEAHQLVRRDGSGRFCLGFELIRLGRVASDSFSLADTAMPVLLDLRDRTGEATQLYVREGDARRCIASVQSSHGLRWIVPVGALLPLDVGSAGHVLADRGPRHAHTVEERERGVASVSSAILDSTGAVVAALSLSGPVERLTRTPNRRFGTAVRDAARELSDLLP